MKTKYLTQTSKAAIFSFSMWEIKKSRFTE